MDGELLQSLPGAELELGQVIPNDEPKVGHTFYGFTEKFTPSVLNCVIVWRAGAPIEMLRKLREGVVLFESDVGETYKFANAFISSPLKVKDESGEVEVQITGGEAKLQ